MRTRKYARIIALQIAGAGLLAMARGTCADEISVGTSQDCMILGGVDTNNSSGQGPGMFAGTDGNGSPKRALVEFNLAQIPAGSTVTSVSLTLYLCQVAGTGGGSGSQGDTTPRTIRLYRLTSAWGQGTTGAGFANLGGTGQGWPAQTGDATWDYAFFNQAPWNQPGGDFIGDNEMVPGAMESADTVVGETLGTPSIWSSPTMVADVQGWVNGTSANDGWLLKNDDETDPRTFRGFWTAEGAAINGIPQMAPNLQVTFTPPTIAWTGAGSGTWQSAGNWGGIVPSGIGVTAQFGSAISTPATITLAGALTQGVLDFNSAQKVTLAGSTITLQTNSGLAAIHVENGSHEIATNVVLGNGVQVNVVNASDVLTISGGISGIGGFSTSGAGTVVLSGTNSYSGATTVGGGTLVLATAAARPSGDVLTISGPVGTAVTIGGAAGQLDSYRVQLAEGMITAGTATANQSIGYLTGAEYNALNGTSIDPTSVVLQKTLTGDVNLDGKITVSDYLALDRAYTEGDFDGSTPAKTAHWVDGDFNDDGVVNAEDYALIDAAYMASTDDSAAAVEQVNLDTRQFGMGYVAAYQAALDTSPVPEPSSLGLLGAGAGMLLAIRRRCGKRR